MRAVHHLSVEAVRRRSRAVRRRASLSSHESSHHLSVEAVRRRSRAVRRRASLSSHESRSPPVSRGREEEKQGREEESELEQS